MATQEMQDIASSLHPIDYLDAATWPWGHMGTLCFISAYVSVLVDVVVLAVVVVVVVFAVQLWLVL